MDKICKTFRFCFFKFTKLFIFQSLKVVKIKKNYPLKSHLNYKTFIETYKITCFTMPLFNKISKISFIKLHSFFINQGCHMAKKSQEKLIKMTKVRKSQVKMGVFEESQEKFRKKF